MVRPDFDNVNIRFYYFCLDLMAVKLYPYLWLVCEKIIVESLEVSS